MKEEDFYYRSCELRSRYLDHIREQRKIIAGVATVENRKNALQECLLSLANQVDEIYLYQNGYDEEVKHNLSCKLYVNNSLKTKIDMGDAGKFYKIDDPGDVYYFSADDDLIYPRNYIDSYIDILYTCNDEIIVTSHGRICHSRVENYYDDKYKLFHYAAYQPTFEPVHFGGTGVMGFRTGRMRVRFSDFPVPNMADIWMGLLAKSFRTPIYVVPRHLDWIKSSEKFDLNTTIYRSRKSTGIDDKIAPHIKLMNFEFVGARVFQRRSFKEYKVISVASKNYILYSNFPIAVAIPTYNRPKLLVRLLKQIDQAAKGFNVNIYVFDDGSEHEASVTIDGIRDELRNISNITVTRFENHGKKRYWQLVNLIFERLEESNSKYFYYLGDDLEVAETFFEESIHAWESIQDEKKMSLNLLCDSRTKSWTDFERVKVDFDEFSVYQNQWLDMIMMCDSKLVGQRVDPISLSRWDVKPLLSSGVGAQLSTRLHSTGKSMYQVIRSLVQHGNHDSLMNPEERRLNPLVAKS
jgi:hypothetical protein